MSQQALKYEILQNLDKEWEYFLDIRIRTQETVFQNFTRPTHRQDIQEDKSWAKDITKLVDLHTKLIILRAEIQAENIRSDIRLFTWQKIPSKNKKQSKIKKQRQILDEYYTLKNDFVRKYPLEMPV
jgi:hypothetical protein